MRTVFNLDTGEELTFDCLTARQAMNSLVYYLGLSTEVPNIINKTDFGNCLYVDINDETWAIIND